MSALSADAVAARAARAVLQRHGRTFFVASRLLGRRHAERAAVLYAFCRHVDNLADEASDPTSARAALAAVQHALRTGLAPDPWTRAMLALQSETGMAVGPALDLVAGVAGDLEDVRVADEAALLLYSYRVAGTVGLMMCAALDVHDPRAHPFAIDLGIAMQLTNIARDVGEDARMGRRYLPASWIGEVAPAAIAEPDLPLQRQLQDATRRLLALADRYYASGESGLAYLPRRARLRLPPARNPSSRSPPPRSATRPWWSWARSCSSSRACRAPASSRATPVTT